MTIVDKECLASERIRAHRAIVDALSTLHKYSEPNIDTSVWFNAIENIIGNYIIAQHT